MLPCLLPVARVPVVISRTGLFDKGPSETISCNLPEPLYFAGSFSDFVYLQC